MRAARLPGAKSARDEPRNLSQPSAVFDRDRRCVSCSPKGHRRGHSEAPARGRRRQVALPRPRTHHPLVASSATSNVQRSALTQNPASGGDKPYPNSRIPAVGETSTARSSQTLAPPGRPRSQANRAQAAASAAAVATATSTAPSNDTVKAPAKRRAASTPPAIQTAKPMSAPAQRAARSETTSLGIGVAQGLACEKCRGTAVRF